MSIFVISLENAKSRQEHIKQEFSKEKIPFSFFKAVTPKDIDNVSEQLGIDVSNTDLTDGEKACFLSHASLWQKLIAENLDYICIFEDDIYLGENINRFLFDISCYPNDFDIIKLESFDHEIVIDPDFKKKIGARELFKLASKSLGTAGYILSRKSAIKLFNYLTNIEKIEPVDHFLFETLVYEKKFNIYYLNPSICKQDFLISGDQNKFTSTIEPERKIRREREKIIEKKEKLGLLRKLRREFLRIINGILKLLKKKEHKIFSSFK
ncbi:glycosyltransferase family 25 protein [Acinetobacter faecalis]|uniref:glycosyltransferase family 25 protein n=1 Tax=Acinetobacter faecalis TaxID=2665161 RepID=UPI002A90E704|nr:glycosyltransferase family 25 protein [Acinetobacter faecalis]MDY6537588.1 glycosyltransferase family 25 protein [Acinetobacter faecalis]